MEQQPKSMSIISDGETILTGNEKISRKKNRNSQAGNNENKKRQPRWVNTGHREDQMPTADEKSSRLIYG